MIRFQVQAAALLLAGSLFVSAVRSADKTRGKSDSSCLSAHTDHSLRSLVPPRWWERVPAIKRVTLKPGTSFGQLSLDPIQAAKQLRQLRAQGFGAIEIFAPAHGGKSFSGLDVKDHYQIDPEVGTTEDFRRLVRQAHLEGLAIITLDNLGYSSVEAPHFLRACDDVRAGKDSRERRWFLWSDSAEAPPPTHGDRYFMIRPRLPNYDSPRHEFWEYSERCGAYYWTKWAGVDSAGRPVRLPQYNWGAREWQEEAERIVRFWMDTGIDGMLIDAVNWYVGYTWETGRRRLTNVIGSYGNSFSQPEGAGGFQDDPAAWITEGGWNCLQNYGLWIWWEKGTNIIANAIETGDPRPIESSLRSYHDRVVAAGGTLYATASRLDAPEKQRLAEALLATVGNLVCFSGGKHGANTPHPQTSWLLQTKRLHPALYQQGLRRRLPTSADDKHYAFLRTAADGSERILVVMNFQKEPQTVEVDLSGVAARELIDLESPAPRPRKRQFRVDLPPFGYRLFQVIPPAD